MKRDDLIRDLRRYARKNGLDFEVDKRGGTGSHYKIRVGDKFTILQSGELDPYKVQRICKQLSIDPTRI
ncbi:hypothetical protein [Methylobacterium sp. WSM2598]|uniref:hypothetical protein n=1 Tax=Methylobacterium sp. WSM2598 TaxID=398261 RepID=UPI00036B4DEF|nr:hypothetical protein [Methylobacterium sp. WSM2598]